MNFQELVHEAREIEKNAVEKRPYSQELKIPKTIDFSPEETVDRVYRDLLNDYERMVKIAKAGGFSFVQTAVRIETPETTAPPAVQPVPAEPELPKLPKPVRPPVEIQSALPAPEAPKPAEKEKPEMRMPEVKAPEIEGEKEKIESEMERLEKEEEKKEEKEELRFEKPGAPEEAEEKREEPEAPEKEKEIEIQSALPAPEAPKPAEKEKPEMRMPEVKAPEIEGEKPEILAPEEAQLVPEPAPKSEEMKAEEAQKVASEVMGESAEIPYLKKHEQVSLAIPPLLSMKPEDAAAQKYSEIEMKVPQVSGKVNETDVKKRMLELTKQLFKEKSMDQRGRIKAEIASLREMLARKAEMPRRASVSYATGFFNAMDSDQKAELSVAKENLSTQYRENLARIMGAFSSSLKIAKGYEERRRIYEALVLDLEALKTQLQSLGSRYESFFLREHTLALERVRAVATMKNDKYALEQINAKLKDMKFAYAAEFLSFEEAVKKEISSLEKSKRHEALETALSEEMEKVLSIVNMRAEELLAYAHSHHPEKYREFEAGKITKLELISQVRLLMAAEAGLTKETINKYFGEI